MSSVFHLNQPQSEYLKSQLQKDQALLEAIKAKLPELEYLERGFQGMYLDGIYRFYRQSFKIFQLQAFTLSAADVL